MVKLDRLPTKSVIKGLAGVLDFYVINGQAIVRRWPKKYTGPSTPKATCNQRRFRDFQKGQKYWNRPTKKLCQHAAVRSGWRWNDYAYKCYMGRVPYAPLFRPPEEPQVFKPCPDFVGRFFLMHHCFLQLWRVSNYPPSHPTKAGQPRYLCDVVFWVNEPSLRLKLVVQYTPPHTLPHWKTQRGETKQCGEEPVAFHNPHEYYLNTPFHNESPAFTHSYSLSEFSEPERYEEWWGYLKMDEEERPWWAPRNGFSVSPMFHYKWPGYPTMEIGEFRFHHLEPLHPIKWDGLKPWSWMTWNAVWRYTPIWHEIDWIIWPPYYYRQEPWYWW